MPKKMVFNLKFKNKITALIKEWKLNQVKQKMQTENIILIICYSMKGSDFKKTETTWSEKLTKNSNTRTITINISI